MTKKGIIFSGNGVYPRRENRVYVYGHGKVPNCSVNSVSNRPSCCVIKFVLCSCVYTIHQLSGNVNEQRWKQNATGIVTWE